MDILLLNEYFPPDTSATAKIAAQVADALAARHRVTVVAGRPSYDPDEYYPFRWLRRDVRGNLTVERVGSTAYPRHRMSRRTANYISYLALAIPRALTVRADVILAMTDPPIEGIAGAIVATLSGRPFVYNIRDLYPDMALGGGLIRSSILARIWEMVHRWALRRATRVVVLGDDMRSRILGKGISAERVVVVRDGTPLPEEIISPADPIAREVRGGFPFVMVHAGNLGFYGAWDTLLKAADLLREEDVALVFIGDGAQRTRLMESARNTPNVRFLPFWPVSEISSVMAAGDVHVITIRRALEGVVVPSKFYSILAAGRPVLSVAPETSDVARIVRDSGCGATADPDDPMAVVEAVRMLRRDPARLGEMGSRARMAAKNYVRLNELEKFVRILEGAALFSR